jgi:hypothetical protein
MRAANNPSEYGAAALGQFGGMLSPESWIGTPAKGATWLWRAMKSGLQQGTANAVANPIVQGLNIEAGVRDQYDPLENAKAFGTGAVVGTAARSLAELLAPSRFYTPGYTRAEQLGINRNVGRAWEDSEADRLRDLNFRRLSPQITLMPPGGPSVRIDLMGVHPETGEVVCFECKSSQTAPLTKRQSEAFNKIEQYGATVRGAGKPGFPGGTAIPPTKVQLLRPRRK